MSQELPLEKNNFKGLDKSHKLIKTFFVSFTAGSLALPAFLFKNFIMVKYVDDFAFIMFNATLIGFLATLISAFYYSGLPVRNRNIFLPLTGMLLGSGIGFGFVIYFLLIRRAPAPILSEFVLLFSFLAIFCFAIGLLIILFENKIRKNILLIIATIMSIILLMLFPILSFLTSEFGYKFNFFMQSNHEILLLAVWAIFQFGASLGAVLGIKIAANRQPVPKHKDNE